MTKQLLIATFFTVCLTTVFGQTTIVENFDDGDFTNSPTWTVSKGAYIIEAGSLKQNDVNGGTSSISLPSSVSCEASWEFSAKLDFDPSTTNYSDIYIMADSADLTKNIKGYFVRIGGASGTVDDITLYRANGDGSKTAIIDGLDGTVSSNPNVRVKVTRTANGVFELLRDITNGTTFTSEGTISDITYTKSNFFGFANTYTSTRKDKFFFDDINISGTTCNIVIKKGGLYINRIIAQACGSPEIQNELVKFTVGDSNISTATMNVNWPTSTSWDGLVQNATTATKVDSMNAQIIGGTACGKFIEPVGGILPANAEVLLLASYLFDEKSWDFGQLKDTIYVIFQNSNRASGGYFKNYDAADSGDRTLIVSFGTDGQDTVTYKPSLLIQDPAIPASYKGAAVNYDEDGQPTYVNEGCEIPLKTVAVVINSSTTLANSGSTCGGDTITLIGKAKNALSKKWTITGDAGGLFLNGSDVKDTAVFVTGKPTTKDLKFKFKVVDKCGANDSSESIVQITDIYPAIATPTYTTADVCAPDTIILTTSSIANSFIWKASNNASISGETKKTAKVATNTSSPATIDFTLTAYGRCKTLDSAISAPTTVTINQKPVLTVTANKTSICPGDTATLTASSSLANTSLTWSANSIVGGSNSTPSIKVKPNLNTTYTVTGTSDKNCVSSQKNIDITVLSACQKSQIIFNQSDLAEENLQPVIYLQGEKEVNRRLGITLIDVKNFSFTIFDRWGSIVYETTNATALWEATTTSGTKVNPGTYFYIIKGTGAQDLVNHEYKGYITVIGN